MTEISPVGQLVSFGSIVLIHVIATATPLSCSIFLDSRELKNHANDQNSSSKQPRVFFLIGEAEGDVIDVSP